MATYKAQVEDLTGALNDDDAISQWLTDGARLVLNNLPTDKLERITEKVSFTNTTTSKEKRILSVHRKDASNGNLFMPARELSAKHLGRVEDSDYMEFATANDPAYILHNNKIQTYPGSAATDDSMVLFVDTTVEIAAGAQGGSVEDVPPESEQVIVLYAARNGLERLISDANVDEDPELVASLLGQYQVVDRQYKEGLQILGIDKLYIEKDLPDRR
tara:strand:+ start:11312 stop:11962 length:651 start_codon:yes stop_codon:yes gene_type:complete